MDDPKLWSSGIGPDEVTRPPLNQRDIDQGFGKPTWQTRQKPHHSGYKIIVYDLPAQLASPTGRQEFRDQWLTSNETLKKARTYMNSRMGEPYLSHWNLQLSPDGTDVAAYLTFNQLECAESCMKVIWQWWRGRPDGSWDFLKVKWMTGFGS